MPVMFRARRDWPLPAVAVVMVVLSIGIGIERTRNQDLPDVTSCGLHSPLEPEPPTRFATFNIEEFPKNTGQVEGAFDVITGLDVGFIAVQEITDPALLLEAAQRRLGPDWRFVHHDTMPVEGTRFPPMHVGVLFDGERYRVLSSILHDQTRLDGRNKPTLEVRLLDLEHHKVFRIFVVHLKAGSDGRAIRARQYQALTEILPHHQQGIIIVLGDFNATEEGDRGDLARLALNRKLYWATADLGCSAFWDRDDGCPTSRLDHVLTSTPPIEVMAGGACADGCHLRDRCPLYAEQVSDHCPVTVTVH